MARYVYGFNSDMKIIGKKQHFLIVFKDLSTGGNPYLVHRSGKEPMFGELTGYSLRMHIPQLF